MKQGRHDSGHGPRYWDINPDAGPGEVVAHHDGGIGLDPTKVGPGQDAPRVSGPGNYTVDVRNDAGRAIPGDDRMPDHRHIELHSYITLAPGQPFRFNRGMARWFGMRLIEAAELDEALNSAGGPASAQIEVDRLAEWMGQHAADWIGEGDLADSVIRLLSHAKRLVAKHGDDVDEDVTPTTLVDGEAQPVDPAAIEAGIQADVAAVTEKAAHIAALREAARSLIDLQSATASANLKSYRNDAIRSGAITEEEWRTEVIGSFDSAEQAIIRGRMT